MDYFSYDDLRAAGDLTYRIECPTPAWDDSEQHASDLGEQWLAVSEMGRKRNPKKQLLRDCFTDWQTVDTYVLIRSLYGKRFPHPAVSMDTDANHVYEALDRVFDPDGSAYQDQHTNTTEGLRKIAPEHPSDADPRDPTAGELWGKWLPEIATASGREAVDVMEMYFRELEDPWILSQAIFNNMTFYMGSKMVWKVLKSEFNPSCGIRAWRNVGDIGSTFLHLSWGEELCKLAPHMQHNTMKANSTSADAVATDLDHDEWVGQAKYDGARLFVHHAGDGDVRAYSAGMRDVTAALPELDTIDWPDCAFIFDCEATPYDADGNAIPFENIMTRLTRDPGSGTIDPADFDTDVVFKFFDCMVWHGRDITTRKFTDRFKVVQSVFDPPNVARTGEDLEATFQNAVEAGHEGLVLKKRDGEYMPGGRHSQWLKWKQEAETIDAKVYSATSGGGRISDRMGALKVSLKFDGEWEPVGRVGTGFSDGERLEFWRDHESGDLAGQIIELEYESLQLADGKWGLRFPRFKRRRPDGEADTVERAASLQGQDEAFDEWAKACRSVS